MKEIGAHKRAEILDDKDINGRYMAMCRDCETCAHAYELTEAETNLSLTPCIIDCANCNKIRHSHDGSPAEPLGGSCNTLLHICPNDGRNFARSEPSQVMSLVGGDPARSRDLRIRRERRLKRVKTLRSGFPWNPLLTFFSENQNAEKSSDLFSVRTKLHY